MAAGLKILKSTAALRAAAPNLKNVKNSQVPENLPRDYDAAADCAVRLWFIY